MKKAFFYRFGKFIHKTRWIIILAFVAGFSFCIPYLPKIMSQFTNTGLVDPHSQSAHTKDYLEANLGYQHNRFIVMYQGKQKFTKDSSFNREIHKSLDGLKGFTRQYEILYPEDNKEQVSKDKRSAYAVVMLKDNKNLPDYALNKLKSKIKKPEGLTMLIGGEPVFQADMQKQTQHDLIRAEYIATPVAVITLLIVFGSVTAAFIPMILDAVCAIFILTILYFLGHRLALSIFTINIALLLGLCLSLDYALFIIYRFREELAEGRPVVEALAMTQATAGKAVFFSGLAVLISLSALFLFPINILFSVGVGGVTAVAMAVLVSIVLLPAILGILKTKINFLPIRLVTAYNGTNRGYWLWMVGKVIRYPWTFFISMMLVLLVMSYPVLNIKIGLSDFHVLPKTMESRQVFDIIDTDFNPHTLTPIVVLVKTPGKFLADRNISNLYNLTTNLSRNASVDDISSIVNTDPKLSKSQYQQLYTGPKQYQSDEIKKLLKFTTGNNFSIATITSKYASTSEQSEALVKKIRATKMGKGFRLSVTGVTANTLDVIHRIAILFPWALLWVIVLTYMVLLILFRSIVLPFKAIIMNMLSLSASYGVLVFIIQDGYLASLLNFDPQGMIDLSLLVIIFCALFGFSMDYEVFLLTRIKEYYEQTGDNNKSIIFGISHSSKIITSAAVVVILICFAFLSADILMVKAFGLGIAVAIFVDAFLIRSILVPATMALLGQWCWYLPSWLDKILPVLSFNPEEKHF